MVNVCGSIEMMESRVADMTSEFLEALLRSASIEHMPSRLLTSPSSIMYTRLVFSDIVILFCHTFHKMSPLLPFQLLLE